jgi:hypothetical protein
MHKHTFKPIMQHKWNYVKNIAFTGTGYRPIIYFGRYTKEYIVMRNYIYLLNII